MTVQYEITACRHVGQNPDHPAHMCPDPLVVPRWGEPNWRVPLRPDVSEMEHMPPVVSLRPWAEGDPAPPRLAVKGNQMFFAQGFPTPGAHLSGECVTCGERHPLTKDGGLRAHGARRIDCEGGGRPAQDGRCMECGKVGATKAGLARKHGEMTDVCRGSGDGPMDSSTRSEPQNLWVMTGPRWAACYRSKGLSCAFIDGRYVSAIELKKWVKEHAV